tara:strand:- start:77 stop:673 length:597 start_codon:yes stop_codon:yes gene_type:complete
MPTVFLDDPNAIPMMKKRIADLEKKKTYWKGIKKTVPRPYDRSEGDARWYMLDNISTKLRTAKKKLEQLEQNKRDGVKLQRNTTYKHGKPRFYYTTEELLESLDNLIDESYSYATAAGTARGAHKAWLTRQHGKDKAKRKKTTGKFSKAYHNWVLNNAADLQNDKAFRDKYSKNIKGKPEWIAMSYIQSHHIARKKFA